MSVGDPFRVDVTICTLSVGRADPRLLRDDPFRVTYGSMRIIIKSNDMPLVASNLRSSSHVTQSLRAAVIASYKRYLTASLLKRMSKSSTFFVIVSTNGII